MDAARFLRDQFGTATDVATALAAEYENSPSYETVRKWGQRGTIPGDWLPALLLILERRTGRPVSLEKYE